MLCLAAVTAARAFSSDLDEFKVKRQEIFEFTDKPKVTRDGDTVTVTFASKAFCDATVAVEDARGRIVRHLASGVLGPKAPEPFQKNALKQTIVWDGKNDKGEYVDDKTSCTVRTSLGLKPQFERTLFWSPQKRIGYLYPTLRAAPEGVYVAESYELSQVRLLDHRGDYVRTVYPFPADKIDNVAGLTMHTFLQDGKVLPLKGGFTQTTLLTCASPRYGTAGISALAAANGRLALVNERLNRLASDGSTGGLPLEGPKMALPTVTCEVWPTGTVTLKYSPLSVALSPDAKWLYLAGCYIDQGYGPGFDWMNAVLRMPYGENKEPVLFVGDMKPGVSNGGAEDGKFRMASSVACDAKGRVYVGDYVNDRVQVFDAEGKHLKSIPAAKPAHVAVHQKTGDIYVFSWMLLNRVAMSKQTEVNPAMTHFGPVENPALKSTCPLPLLGHSPGTSWNIAGGLQHRVELDSWADRPTVWVLNGKVGSAWSKLDVDGVAKGAYAASHIRMYEETDGKLTLKRSFADEVQKSVQRITPPILWRQRLYVNPVNEKLYVAEADCGVMKAVNQLIEISPDTGQIKQVELPLGAEGLCFDLNGLLYIRTDTGVARYTHEAENWREVPWDYGEEKGLGFGMGARGASLRGALVVPGHRSLDFWHLGGIDISPRGHLVVTTCTTEVRPQRSRDGGDVFNYAGKPYIPKMYPGRARWGEIHIWDKHGKLVTEDAVPGMGHLNGIGIDSDDNLYMMSSARRIIDGKPVEPSLDLSGTVLKVPAGKAKMLSTSGGWGLPLPLPKEAQPSRPQDLAGGSTTGWLEGAEWFYGGVGFCAQARLPLGECICWNCRFAKDYFNRSFAPETLHYSVAVLDSSGNLILRLGKYGNVEDGKPLIAEGGPANPRSIGGDEVALFHACYVGVHTDRRLFIADAGNARILSVRLDYHATEKVALKDVPEAGK